MPERPTPVTTHLLREWRLPPPGSDKESRGVVLVVGGSRSTPGAVILGRRVPPSAWAAGSCRSPTVDSVAGQVSVTLPEALVRGFTEAESGDLAVETGPDVVAMAEGPSAALLGPGMLDPRGASALLAGIVPELSGPVVVDALGSAYVTDHPDGLHHLGGSCVLTLNVTELAETLHQERDDVEADLIGAAIELATRTKSVVLCGGATKCVAGPSGQTWVIEEGGPGLGVSGSGDVQAGLVAGLLARGCEPVQAATWAGYLHGRAGDRLAGEVGTVGFLARELPPVVPDLLTELDQ